MCEWNAGERIDLNLFCLSIDEKENQKINTQVSYYLFKRRNKFNVN